NTANVLELYGTMAGLALAKDLGCEVTLAESDDAVLKMLSERARTAGLTPRVKTSKVALDASGDLPYGEGGFDGLLVLGRILMPLEDAASKLRRYLAMRGRLVVTWPVKVGLRPPRAAVDFWQQRIGAAVLTPRETLMSVEQ